MPIQLAHLRAQSESEKIIARINRNLDMTICTVCKRMEKVSS